MKYAFLSMVLTTCLLTTMSVAVSPCGPAADCGCPTQRCNSCIDTNPCDACRHRSRPKRHVNEGKICQSVPTTKKSKTTCFKSECEDFCLPSPGKGPLGLFHQFLKGSKCGNGCRTASCDCPQPVKMGACGKVRTKKKLYMREVETEKPTYRCEVKSGGTSCGASCGASCGKGCADGLPIEMPVEEAPLGPVDTNPETPVVVPLPSS